MNESFYSLCFTKTPSSKALHSFLILVEYIIFLFPSIFNSILKANYYGKPIDLYTQSVSPIAYLHILHYFHLNRILPIVLTSLSLLLILLYYLMLFLNKIQLTSKGCSPLQRVIAFIYNIVLYRYLSILFFDASLYLCFLFFSQGGLVNTILSLIIFIFFIVLLITTYYHIEHCSLILSISNRLLMGGAGAGDGDDDKRGDSLHRHNKHMLHYYYPYDSISKLYDNPLLVIKALIAFEHHAFDYIKTITPIILTLNASITIMSIGLFIRLVHQNLFLKVNLTLFYGNVSLNYLRKTIALFNFLLVSLGIVTLLFNSDPLKKILYAAIMSLNITIIFIIPEYFYVAYYLIEKQPLSYKALLLILISDTKRHSAFVNKLLNSFYFNHRFDCDFRLMGAKEAKESKRSQCDICIKYNDNVNDNILLFYKAYRKSQMQIKSQSQSMLQPLASSTIEEELVKLFYYHITKKKYKYFLWYNNLLYKYTNKNIEYIHNLKLIAEYWLSSNDISLCDNSGYNIHSSLILELIHIRAFELKSSLLLKDIGSFLDEHIRSKRPETIVSLSSQMNSLMNTLITFITNQRERESSLSISSHSDSNSKLLNGIYNYNVILLRFIFESLMNRQLDDLNPLSIEFYDDYLMHHYQFDQLLICKVDLSSTVFHQIKLLKTTGFLAHKNNDLTYLCDFFPKDLKQIGVQIIYDTLKSNKACIGNDVESQKQFTFPYISTGVMYYIRYSFTILDLIKEDQLILYGKYYIEKGNNNSNISSSISNRGAYMLIRDEDGSIIGFCNEVLRLIRFKPKWIVYLEEINLQFTLGILFKSLSLQSLSTDANANNANANAIDDNNSNSNTHKTIICEFNYDHYIKHSEILINQLEDYSKFNTSPKAKEELASMTKALIAGIGSSYRIILDKVISYPNKVTLYQVNFKEHHCSLNKDNQCKDTKDWYQTIDNFTNPTNNISNMNNAYQDFQTYSLTNTTNTLNNTKSSMTQQQKSQQQQAQQLAKKAKFYNEDNADYHNLHISVKEKIINKTNTLTVYSLVMIGLNILLIIICIVFLITQITQTQVLINLTQFYFQFKTLRMVLVNFFLMLSATICIADKDHDNSSSDILCHNGFIVYNDYIREQYGLDESYDLLEYFRKELKLKSDFAMTLLIDFKAIVYKYRSLDLEQIFSKIITTYYFKDDSEGNGNGNELVLKEEQISFEEAFKVFSNRINVITLSPIPYHKIPMYLISHLNSTYTFENVPNGTLSPMQKELYLGILNHIHFFANFDNDENLIKSKIYTLKDTNELSNYVFMISIGLLNLVLLVICYLNIQTAYQLFTMIINNSINKTEEKESGVMLKEKIANLRVLCNLYEKNPPSVIKRLTNAAHNQHSEALHLPIATASAAAAEALHSSQYEMAFDPQFKTHLLKTIIIVFVISFTLYFIIVIAFDAVLISMYESVFNLFNYIYYEHDYENVIYITISLSLFSSFTNYTNNEEFAVAIKKKHPSDGPLNDFVRKSALNYKYTVSYLSTNDSLYPSLSGFFSEYTCDNVFKEYDDIYLTIISKELGTDYRLVSIALCNNLGLLNIADFGYLRNDLILRIQMLVNTRPDERDYDTVSAYRHSFAFYELCTVVLLGLRVLNKLFRDSVLLPAITTEFQFYVELGGIYLSVNIILEITIFIIVKWVISKRLKEIQRDLYLFNNCLNSN